MQSKQGACFCSQALHAGMECSATVALALELSCSLILSPLNAIISYIGICGQSKYSVEVNG